MIFCIDQDIQLSLHLRESVFRNGQTSNKYIKTFQKICIHPNIFKKISILHFLLGRNLNLLI